MKTLQCAGLLFLAASVVICNPSPMMAQRIPTERHVREVANYLDRVTLAEPIVYGHWAVYPVLTGSVPPLSGRWRTLGASLEHRDVAVREKKPARLAVVEIENLTSDQYVLAMSGEVLTGGDQDRAVRTDLLVAPGQTTEINVFSIDPRRSTAPRPFTAGGVMVPQSVERQFRKGINQTDLWAMATRISAALNPRDKGVSLAAALKSRAVEEKLDPVRRRIMPRIPDGMMGFIIVDRGDAVGADFLR